MDYATQEEKLDGVLSPVPEYSTQLTPVKSAATGFRHATSQAILSLGKLLGLTQRCLEVTDTVRHHANTVESIVCTFSHFLVGISPPSKERNKKLNTDCANSVVCSTWPSEI